MISPELSAKFKLVEMAWFPVWRKASPKRRKQISKAIGEWEAKEIIREIESKTK